MKAANRAMLNGLAGALAFTVAHEYIRRSRPNAPQLDVVSKRNVASTLKKIGVDVEPNSTELGVVALLADIVSNTMFFSKVGDHRGLLTLARGVNLGVFAGVGAVTIPEKLGLAEKTKRSPSTILATIGLYVFGGIVAAVCAQIAGRAADSSDDVQEIAQLPA